MTETTDVLREHVSDMLTVEKHTLESIERQTRDDRVKSYREAYELLMKIESTLSMHTMALDQYLSSINGGAQSLLKKAASTAVGTMAGIYGRMRTGDPVSRNLRDDYTALSLAAISYTMLYTTARALDDSKVADMSLRHLHELTPLIVGLSKVIPEVVARELTQEGKAIYATAGPEAVNSTHKAWSHDVVGHM